MSNCDTKSVGLSTNVKSTFQSHFTEGGLVFLAGKHRGDVASVDGGPATELSSAAAAATLAVVIAPCVGRNRSALADVCDSKKLGLDAVQFLYKMNLRSAYCYNFSLLEEEHLRASYPGV